MNMRTLFKKFALYVVVFAVIVLPTLVPAGPAMIHADQIDGNPVGLDNPIKGVDDIYEFVALVLENVVIPIGSVIVVLMFIYSGFLFVTARGNEDQIKTARHIFLNVVIGTVILLGSVVIAQVIKNTICDIADIPGCVGGSPFGN